MSGKVAAAAEEGRVENIRVSPQATYSYLLWLKL